MRWLFTLTVLPFAALFFLPETMFAQGPADVPSKFELSIKKIEGAIKIDGDLDDEAWKSVEATTHFYKKFPNDDGDPQRQTQVKTTYDNNYIYFAFTAFGTNAPV